MRLIIIILTLLYITISSPYSLAATQLVAAKQEPKPSIKALLVNTQSDLVDIQQQISQLEIQLSKNNNDLQVILTLQKKLQALNTDVKTLKESILVNEKIKLESFDSKIESLIIYITMMALVFGLIIISVVFFVINKSKREIPAEEWFEDNNKKLLSLINNEISAIKNEVQSFVINYDNPLKLLKIEHEKHIKKIQEKILIDKASEEEKLLILGEISKKNKDDYTLNDYLSAGYKAYINKNIPIVIKFWEFVSKANVSSIEENAMEDNAIIARLLRNLGVIYEGEGDTDKAIEIYNNLINQFNNYTNINIQFEVVTAMRNLGACYGKTKLLDQEIEIYNRLIKQFSDIDTHEIQSKVAETFYCLGLAQMQQGDINEAINSFDYLNKKFKYITCSQVQKMLLLAANRAVELALLKETPNQILKRIEAIERDTIHNETLTIMSFLRFLLDDIKFSSVINLIAKLPTEINSNSNFTASTDYFNSFSGIKRQQIDAFVDFFENHQDKDKFLDIVRTFN